MGESARAEERCGVSVHRPAKRDAEGRQLRSRSSRGSFPRSQPDRVRGKCSAQIHNEGEGTESCGGDPCAPEYHPEGSCCPKGTAGGGERGRDGTRSAR